MKEIPFGRPLLGDAEKRAVAEVLEGPVLVHGPRAAAFERDFADWTGAPRAVSVSSCTAGLHLAYFDLGIGPGDEVLVPAQTHVATAHAVAFTGARPVFVDAEIETGNVDLEQLAAAVTERTRAVSIVHFLGYPVAMDRVLEIASAHGLFVVEDCALAIGTRYKGVHAGLFGDVGCFSFYPVKHMTTAEGGMSITRHENLADRLMRERAFGVDRHVGERRVPGQYDVTRLGYNYRMNEIQAAIGIEQLKRMNDFLDRRRENFAALAGAVDRIEEVRRFADDCGDRESSRYCLSILLDDDLIGRRPEIVAHLNERGIGTSVYYPKPVPHMQYYRETYGIGEETFPVAARISGSSIALPVGPHLEPDDMMTIGRTLEEAIASVKRHA